MAKPIIKSRYSRPLGEEPIDEGVGAAVVGKVLGSSGKRVRSSNDQFLVRIIRQKIEQFNSAETTDEKLVAVMALSALAASGMIQNPQMSQSLIRYVGSRL